MRNRFILHSALNLKMTHCYSIWLIKWAAFYFFPFLLPFCFAVVSLHDPFRGELGKSAVAKSTSEQVGSRMSPRSPIQLSLREIIAHRDSHRTTPTICKGHRRASLLCFLFCHGNTDYLISLDVVCLSSRNHELVWVVPWKPLLEERKSLVDPCGEEKAVRRTSVLRFNTALLKDLP